MENQCATHISGFTFGRSLNFDRARWAGRWSTGTCMLRISLCGANAMYFWPVWVSPSYWKLQRNPYCDHRIFPFFLMLGVEPLLRAWLNYQASRVVIKTWYLTRAPFWDTSPIIRNRARLNWILVLPGSNLHFWLPVEKTSCTVERCLHSLTNSFITAPN